MLVELYSILEKMQKYLDNNDIIYTLSSHAPDTYERLKTECTPNNLIVWNGASETSIWGKEGNYLFRAFHDHIHLSYDLSFSDEDEGAVCDKSIELLKLNPSERRLMEIEIKGQLDYKNKYGDFPVDQLAFTIKALEA